VIVYMYMREPVEELDTDPSVWPRVAAGVLAAGVVVLGVFPGILSSALRSAAVLRW